MVSPTLSSDSLTSENALNVGSPTKIESAYSFTKRLAPHFTSQLSLLRTIWNKIPRTPTDRSIRRAPQPTGSTHSENNMQEPTTNSVCARLFLGVQGVKMDTPNLPNSAASDSDISVGSLAKFESDHLFAAEQIAFFEGVGDEITRNEFAQVTPAIVSSIRQRSKLHQNIIEAQPLLYSTIVRKIRLVPFFDSVQFTERIAQLSNRPPDLPEISALTSLGAVSPAVTLSQGKLRQYLCDVVLVQSKPFSELLTNVYDEDDSLPPVLVRRFCPEKSALSTELRIRDLPSNISLVLSLEFTLAMIYADAQEAASNARTILYFIFGLVGTTTICG